MKRIRLRSSLFYHTTPHTGDKLLCAIDKIKDLKVVLSLGKDRSHLVIGEYPVQNKIFKY